MRRALALAVFGVAGCISIADVVPGDDGGAVGDATIDHQPSEASVGGDGGVDADGGGACACPGSFADAVMKLPGLLGYWRLDESPGTAIAADRTGKHPGRYGASVTQGVPGLLVGDPDLAAAFYDDAGSYVDIDAAADLDLQTFTLGALIDPSAITQADMGQQIVAKNDAYWLQLDAPKNGGSLPRLEVGFNAPYSPDAAMLDYEIDWPSAELGVGTKSFVVGTYSGSFEALYVNGTALLPSPAPADAAIRATTGDLYIGSWDGTIHLQAGVVDEVFVTSGAISAAQVCSLELAWQGCVQDGG